jgi:IS5 family transposase
LVAGQDVEQDDDGTWKIAHRVAKDRIISTVDPEARHMHKSRSEYRDGYKAHIAIEPETGLITAAALTPANTADGPTGVELLAGEEPGLQVLADGAYGSGETLVALEEAKHRRAIKPHPLSIAIAGGFDRDDFVVDEAAGTATCPAGHSVRITPKRSATFGALCRRCSLRERCTKSKDGRTLRLHPHDDELVESRRAWRDGDFAEDYRRWRPMVERSIAWLVANGHRRVRFRGVEKNQLGLSLRVAAINLRRLVNLGLVRDGEWQLKTT